jgi:SAM-dependent methyltransferase
MVRNQVRVVGVEDEKILDAMLEIKRHDFVVDKFKSVAYSDSELPISETRLIARPEMIAKLLELSKINSDDNVLEIGCGTGYASHLISMIAKSIVGVDNCKKIISTAKKLIGNKQNLAFIHQDFNKISIAEATSLIIVNGAVFDKRSDFSTIQDKSDLFDFHSAMLIDDLISKMPRDCCLISVEGYYKYHPMHVVRYKKDSREVLDQVYFPEIRL